MIVEFTAASLEVIASKGKEPGKTLTLRSFDPIKVDGVEADTVNDGRYSVGLTPGASDWLRDRLAAVAADPEAESSVAFTTAIREGSVTLPDFKQGKRAAHGQGILSLIPAMAGNEVTDQPATDPENVSEPTTDTDEATDTDDAPKARQRRS